MAKLGNLVTHCPGTIPHKLFFWRIIGWIVLLLTLGLPVIIWQMGWSWWLLLLMPVTGITGLILSERSFQFAASFYENGLVKFTRDAEPLVLLWEQTEIGESEYHDHVSFHCKPRKEFERSKRDILVLDTNKVVIGDEAIRICRELPYPRLRELWAETCRNDSVVKYKAVSVTKDGVYFEKIGKMLAWKDIESFQIYDTFSLAFRLPNARVFKTELSTYDVPHVYHLMRFAEEIRQNTVEV